MSQEEKNPGGNPGPKANSANDSTPLLDLVSDLEEAGYRVEAEGRSHVAYCPCGNDFIVANRGNVAPHAMTWHDCGHASAIFETANGYVKAQQSRINLDDFPEFPGDEPKRSESASKPEVDPEAEFFTAVMRESYRIRVRHAAEETVAAEEHAQTWKQPTDSGSLADELALPDEDPEWRIKGLLGVGHNAIPVARRKAGKTTLITNLVRAIVDEQPFLNRFDVTPVDGNVAVFNYEVDEKQFRRWLRDAGIANVQRVYVLHLRGKTLPLSNSRVRDWTIGWLRDRNIKVWIPDPYSRAYVGSVDNGNDEAQVGKFLDTLDVIKAEAGVSELVMPTHTPKARAENGEESAIGSQRLEAWPDSMWYLTREADEDGGFRYLRAEGRDVDVPEEQLHYDAATRSLVLGGWDRKTTGRRRESDQVVAFVAENPGCSQNKIQHGMGWGATKTKAAVRAAGLRLRKEDGPNNTNLHFVTGL